MHKIKEMTRLVKYGLVGGLAFIVEYSSFIVLISLFSTRGLIIAQTISFCLGLLTSFLGSRMFTFRNKSEVYHHKKRTQLTNYLLLAIINLILANVVIHLLIEQYGLWYWIAKVIVMIGVVAWNYVILNRFIFKTK